MSIGLASSLLGIAGVALLVSAPAIRAQSVEDRVAQVKDGKVRMSFSAKPNVCGNGRNMISWDNGRSHSVWRNADEDDWESDCDHGPVRVVLRMRDGHVHDVNTYVGGRWRSSSEAVDLGLVPAQEAADYLLSLTRRARSHAAKEAILPAMLADDVEVWPELLDIAKDGSVSSEVRKSAVFWLSQAAGRAATEGLDELVADESEDREIRAAAIFGLSQRPADEGVPALIRVAKSSSDPELRRKALFWLGQTNDPRAIALFEEILTQR